MAADPFVLGAPAAASATHTSAPHPTGGYPRRVPFVRPLHARPSRDVRRVPSRFRRPTIPQCVRVLVSAHGHGRSSADRNREAPSAIRRGKHA